MEYRVTWTIDLEAESFEDAARIALEIQRDPESLATHFIVQDRHGNDRALWADHLHPCAVARAREPKSRHNPMKGRR